MGGGGSLDPRKPFFPPPTPPLKRKRRAGGEFSLNFPFLLPVTGLVGSIRVAKDFCPLPSTPRPVSSQDRFQSLFAELAPTTTPPILCSFNFRALARCRPHPPGPGPSSGSFGSLRCPLGSCLIPSPPDRTPLVKLCLVFLFHPRIETLSVNDSPDVLDRQKCLAALASLRHAKWFQVCILFLYLSLSREKKKEKL